jgi:molecular chaperone DnaK (HSP70)
MAKYVFGIDLGTTYSCIAYVDEKGEPKVINNCEGDNTTPSVVNFASPTQVVVGQVAKETAVIDPKNTIQLVKALMGKSDFVINYDGKDRSPEEVSSYILRKLTEDASKTINTDIKDVVITCPAYFGTAERTATKNAGIIAGLNVLEIISEPTAAAIYYGCAKEQSDKTILVYDLGGGTFDVTIMSISADKIEVICSDGAHARGGKDWDEAIIRYLAREFKSETGFDGDFDEYAKQDMRLKAEKAKQQLTQKDAVPVILDVDGQKARINLSLATFNEITRTLLNETIEKTDAAIAVAKDKGYAVDEILLVGGSTRMRQVAEILRGKYAMEPKILDPDEAVAKGAAIHAVDVYINNRKSVSEWELGASAGDSLNTPPPVVNKENYQEELKVDRSKIGIGGKQRQVVVATTKSFALRVMVGDQPKCNNLIIKNEPMSNGAISVTRQYGTYAANMNSVELIVYESDFMEEYYDVDEYFVLGTAVLELPGNLPKGAPIEVTFTLNTEGILAITGRDATNNKEVRATMQSKGIMASEEVEKLKEKSKQITIM